MKVTFNSMFTYLPDIIEKPTIDELNNETMLLQYNPEKIDYLKSPLAFFLTRIIINSKQYNHLTFSHI